MSAVIPSEPGAECHPERAQQVEGSAPPASPRQPRWPELCLGTGRDRLDAPVERTRSTIRHAMLMHSHTAPDSSISRRRATSDRRQRARLRDLCDEVLASFRLANGHEPISEQDRRAARELMRGLAPMGKLTAN